jgi:hypothetical protein
MEHIIFWCLLLIINCSKNLSIIKTEACCKEVDLEVERGKTSDNISSPECKTES